jgi:hypothetical protein
MRTSGGRGSESWIMVIPLAAMFVAATISNGGPDGMILLLEGTIRATITAVVTFFSHLF